MSFIPYQVDYSIANTAKTLGFSKKKVTFKFGFANASAIRQGSTGAQCRGSEHEVTFVWSLKTGKRQLFLDNKDVHFSESGQNGWTTDRAWQHVFHIRDSTLGSLRCHFVSQPKNPDIPDSKPFDLRINGVSYFGFNQIFKLGTPAMVVRDVNRGRGGHHSGRDSPMSPEERQAVAAAKVESLREFREQRERQQQRSQAEPKTTESAAPTEGALISFDDPPPPATTEPRGNEFTSSLTLDSAIADAGGPWLQTTGVTQASPYGGPPPMYGQQQRPPTAAAAAVPPQQAPPAASTALTPYSSAPGQAGAPAPYVDATGRVSMGAASPAPAPYSYGSPYTSTPQSQVSYGSAPSFATPAMPPAQQPVQQTTSASSYFSPAQQQPPTGTTAPPPMPMQQAMPGQAPVVSAGGYAAPAPPATMPMQQPMRQVVSTGSYPPTAAYPGQQQQAQQQAYPPQYQY